VGTFPVAAVILGAGAGSRFGQPKAGARLDDGRTFLNAVCGTARDAGLAPIVAVLPPGVAAPDGVIAVVNARGDDEQVLSLRLGLAHLTNEPVVGAVSWPVDHPFVSLESVLALLDAARRTRAPVVRPAFEGRHGHPVFFHRDTWRDLMTVATGGARAVVHAQGTRAISVPVRDAGVVRDIDTRADLAAP
jgi:CTP:molybdopterin cytidylyltransferase MocA